ncbi:HNH endonuclease [Paraburkholderia xenovorans]
MAVAAMARIASGRAREATQKYREVHFHIPRPKIDWKLRTPTTPEERNARKAEWRRANPESVKASKHRNRAKRRNAAGTHTACEIRELFSRQRGCCAVCRILLPKDYHEDHVVPLTRGGSNDIGNIQLLCPHCNRTKSDKDPITFMQQRGFLL